MRGPHVVQNLPFQEIKVLYSIWWRFLFRLIFFFLERPAVIRQQHSFTQLKNDGMPKDGWYIAVD